jgi:predicted TIM-barrel fold metal-dependent hydrolase
MYSIPVHKPVGRGHKREDAMLTRRDMLHQLSAAGAMALGGGARAASAATRSATDLELPRGACDCHVHVFDPKKFPYAADRVYTPPEASVEELLQLQRNLHLERVVVVNPSVYGTDNTCTIDAVRRIGARARGIAVIDKATPRAALDEMAAAGVRGVRLNLETNTAGKFEPSAANDLLDQVAAQIDGLNWHVQMFTRLSVIAALRDHLLQLPLRVVFDHFGRAAAAQGPSQPGFAALLDLVKSGHVYVKISGAYRISQMPPDYPDAALLAQALIAANAERIVWGTDWPHTIPGSASRSARLRRRSRSTTQRCSVNYRNGRPTRRSASRFWSTIRRASTASSR